MGCMETMWIDVQSWGNELLCWRVEKGLCLRKVHTKWSNVQIINLYYLFLPYIKVIETLSLNDEVTDFLDMLGPFYVFLPEEIKSKSTSSSPVSTKSASAVHMKSINNLQESMVDDQVTSRSLCS